MSTAHPPSPGSSRKKLGRNGLTQRQEKFCQAIVSGKGPSEAHGIAGYAVNGNPRVVAVKAQTVRKHPLVKARIEELQGRAVKRVLLTLEARLGLLAENAQMRNTTAAHRNAQARAIEVYTRIAGDGAPEIRDPILTDEDLARSPLRITVNIFRDAPSRVRNVTPSLSTNGNGNGTH